MITSGTVIQGTFTLGVAWILWRILREYIIRSPLDNIPGPAPTSLLKGNYAQFFNRHGWDFQEQLEGFHNGVVKLTRMFGRNTLWVYDPKALHSIIVKDQYVYEETDWFTTSNRLVFGIGLLSTYGEHHRKQRKLLNPVFSINHMRHMTPIFYRITHSLRDAIASNVKNDPKDIDMLGWMGRTALELIGQGGLGYSFDPLVEDVPNDFGDALKSLLPTLFSLQAFRTLTPLFAKIGSPALRRRIMEMIPNANVQKLKKIVDTMDSRTKEIYYMKKAAFLAGDDAVTRQIGEGKDIMSILLKANMTASEQDRLSDEELFGQMSMLVFAAMDTTSSALSNILQLLSQHPEVQEKLRKEISEARDGDDISYDRLVELPYLDAVCRETLRLYPPVTFVFRKTRKDIVMPLSQPIRGIDGTMMHEIPVPAKTTIAVAIRASNRNKAIWGEDALEWKPERWLSPLPETVSEARIPGVYANLMTFIGGGRACIGFKFSQLEMKVVLSVLLDTFKFSPPGNAKDIVWNLAGVKYPTVGRDGQKPAMPMKVELLRKN